MPGHYKVGDTVSGYDLKDKKKVDFKINSIKTTSRGGRIAMGTTKEGHKIARILPKE
jgi:hypothetical protein